MYIPKSRILTNQYTSDNKLQYKSTKEFYVGFYYKTFDGKYYTGKTQNDPPNDELVKVENTETTYNQTLPQNEIAFTDAPTIFNSLETPGYNEGMVVDYANLQDINLDQSTRKFLPYQHYPKPTEDDYNLGSFVRYFCVKINQPIYLELNKKIYEALVKQDSSYLWEPYNPFQIQWTLTGNKNFVEETNNNIVLLQEKRNKRIKFGRFLKFNFLKFYK
jgi:hypothetical protein